MMAAVAAKVQAEMVPYIGGSNGPRKLRIDHKKAFNFPRGRERAVPAGLHGSDTQPEAVAGYMRDEPAV